MTRMEQAKKNISCYCPFNFLMLRRRRRRGRR
jgi:hypothetical protein